MPATIIYPSWTARVFYLITTAVLFNANTVHSKDIGLFNFLDGKNQVEIPFYTFNNQIILRITVNHKIPLNFLLDTGSKQAMIFDLKLAKDLGIPLGRKVNFAGVGSRNQVVAYRTPGVTLTLPGIEGERLGMVVLSQDYLGLEGYDIQGLIGYQFFFRFAVKIDYQKRILTVSEPACHQPSAQAETFDLAFSGTKPILQAHTATDEQGYFPSNLLIDTGASYHLSIIMDSAPHLNVKKKGWLKSVGKGLGGNINGRIHMIKLKLDQKSYDLETICLNSKNYSHKGKSSEGIHGAIGAGFLRSFTVTFNYLKQKIHFEAVPKGTLPATSAL